MAFKAGATYTQNKSITLYAVWKRIKKEKTYRKQFKYIFVDLTGENGSESIIMDVTYTESYYIDGDYIVYNYRTLYVGIDMGAHNPNYSLSMPLSLNIMHTYNGKTKTFTLNIKESILAKKDWAFHQSSALVVKYPKSSGAIGTIRGLYISAPGINALSYAPEIEGIKL